MLMLDHLAVSAERLEDGADAIEATLGVALAPGGRHASMGTWNRLLSLGPATYLEVIAIDPAAPPPGRPRWFGLDGFDGTARLTNWIVATDDLDAALRDAVPCMSAPMEMTRGDLQWRIAAPVDGPWQATAPALIEWGGPAHPAARLPDAGCRLAALAVSHPDMQGLLDAWPALGAIPGVALDVGPAGIRAEIDTPGGRRTLG